MKRILLGLALAAAAYAPATASAIGTEPCGETLQPECDVCVVHGDERICVPMNVRTGS